MALESKFGVLGTGSVGSSMIHALSPNHPYEMHDISNGGDWAALLQCEIVFICVPTDLKENGHLDGSIVENCIDWLLNDSYCGVIAVKSTLPIGFCDKIMSKKPGLRLTYVPEFLRENNSYTWCEHPDRIVIAGNDPDVEIVLKYIPRPEGIPLLRMSYREAEMGKIAHNAYIAVKVSFTNMIELGSKKSGIDPEKVMSVIWADRRIICREHLRPGLGGYSGKCIPKDTSELEAYLSDIDSDNSMISAAELINSKMTPSIMCQYPDVVTIIPVSQQDTMYRRALESVCSQTFRPTEVLVVYDESKGLSEELNSTISEFTGKLNIRLICNDRAQSLSGAVNSALDTIKSYDPDTFVALLDDDDYWSKRYIQNSLCFALDAQKSVVVSGLIRHDSSNPDGWKQPIPQSVSVHDFLIGNPNIQGSNLFIKLSTFLNIGGFSEDLISTTDRDLCIRLLENGSEFGILHNHLVHHDCLSRKERLSSPGNPRKVQGLKQFYEKYNSRMTPEEKCMFQERAKKLFNIDLNR